MFAELMKIAVCFLSAILALGNKTWLDYWQNIDAIKEIPFSLYTKMPFCDKMI